MKLINIYDEKHGELSIKRISDTKTEQHGRNTYQDRAIKASRSRPLYVHHCPMCGVEFEGIKTAVTCSPNCRKRLQRLRSPDTK